MDIIQQRSRNAQSVWILARPLSACSVFPPFEWTSRGKYPLCHWGVLVSPLSVVDVKALLYAMRQTRHTTEDSEIGIMWELEHHVGQLNTVNVTRPFTVSCARKFWNTFNAECVGGTTYNRTAIQAEGTRRRDIRLQFTVAIKITKERPDYKLFENNCQNFAKFLGIFAFIPPKFPLFAKILDRHI